MNEKKPVRPEKSYTDKKPEKSDRYHKDGKKPAEPYKDDPKTWIQDSPEVRSTTARQRKSRRRTVSAVILVLACCIFCYAGFNLFKIWREYHKGKQEYNEVAAEVTIRDPDASGQKEGEVDPTERGDVSEVPAIDWDKLRKINPDVCGWLYFPQPEIINYPVTHGVDNDFYLHHTVEKNYNSAGCLFADVNNTPDMTDRNTIIYGHSMNNGSMFGELDQYADEKFFKENPYFYFLTPDGNAYKYQVAAFYETTDQSDSYRIGFDSDEDYRAYQEQMIALSVFPSGAEADPARPMLTLSTCTNRTESGRFLLQGILKETLEKSE